MPSLADVASAVRRYVAAEPPYDHRTFLPDVPAARKWMGEDVRAGYAWYKYAMARVVKPQAIVEVGVGLAVAAHAFLEASPGASYTGYDNLSEEAEDFGAARQALMAFEGQIQLVRTPDSMLLACFPACDLCHVDGAHDYDHAYSDVVLALRAAEWVLVDDTRDSQVAAATFRALYDWRRGDVAWAGFEDTWRGMVLIHTKEGEK